MNDCYIYDAVRTPRGRGKAGGGLATVTPLDLAAHTLRALTTRNSFDPALVDDVILGCVEPAGEQGANIARVAVLQAGWPQNVPGVQINRFCASGLEAVNMAAAKVMCGMSPLTVAGGVESMSRVPMGTSGGAWPVQPDTAFQTYFVPQGISADLIATLHGFSRDDVDAYAAESQLRAASAQDEGAFDRAVVPVYDKNGLLLLDKDEHPRRTTTPATLASLRPAFAQLGAKYGFDGVALQRYPTLERIDHVHTAGNSSGIVDGASAVLLGSLAAGKQAGLTPRAKIRSFASIGSEPSIMLTAPAAASKKALAIAGLCAADVDLWEINEAFSSVVLLAMQELGISHQRTNVLGGAIALGHPLGATGAMLLATLLDELERQNKQRGLVTLCVGAGMGTATLIERVDANGEAL
ncbi:MAG: acetyl-CoA C-acetyltransferase [Bradymonadia bacterium]|jgi:acetyl-CoA C-acetyltransferase